MRIILRINEIIKVIYFNICIFVFAYRSYIYIYMLYSDITQYIRPSEYAYNALICRYSVAYHASVRHVESTN